MFDITTDQLESLQLIDCMSSVKLATGGGGTGRELITREGGFVSGFDFHGSSKSRKGPLSESPIRKKGGRVP